MNRSRKPARKCYRCLLNQGDHCWLYKYPRGQWQGHKHCPAFENEPVYEQFRSWRKLPDVKTRHDLRRRFFRSTRQKRYRSHGERA